MERKRAKKQPPCRQISVVNFICNPSNALLDCDTANNLILWVHAFAYDCVCYRLVDAWMCRRNVCGCNVSWALFICVCVRCFLSIEWCCCCSGQKHFSDHWTRRPQCIDEFVHTHTQKISNHLWSMLRCSFFFLIMKKLVWSQISANRESSYTHTKLGFITFGALQTYLVYSVLALCVHRKSKFTFFFAVNSVRINFFFLENGPQKAITFLQLPMPTKRNFCAK